MNETSKISKGFFLSEEYEGVTGIYDNKEEAIDKSWMKDESNVTHVIEYTSFEALALELQKAKDHVTSLMASDMKNIKLLQKSKDREKALVKIVQFYADKELWRSEVNHKLLLCEFLKPEWGPIARDNNGQQARDALKAHVENGGEV